MKRKAYLRIKGLPCLIVLFLGMETGSVLAEFSHEIMFPIDYSDEWNCQTCHPRAANEVMDSVHYLWRSENPLVEFPGGGSHGMIDRVCGLVGSNAIINYDEHCGKCHVGDSLPLADPQTGLFTDDQKANLDCMICHAADGMYDTNNDGVSEPGELADDKPLVYDADRDRWVWHQDRRTEAARSVGCRVTNEACLRCHYHRQADYHYKRGTPFDPETDVHAAAGLHCTDCHLVDYHKMARGSRVTDMFAWERQDVDVRCENCHTEAPHRKMTILNQRTERIGCETCHIPEVAGARRRVWSSTLGVTEAPESQIPIFDDTSGKYLPYSTYDDALVSPSYRWFAGGASMLAEPIVTPGAFNMQPATRDTLAAKILPFRKFVSGQPMDARGIVGMPDFDPGFTMAGALNQMAPILKMTGFMRPEGMTPQEQGVMSQFPNMLLFDRADYFATGDVAAAVSIGMAKQGAFMQGMDIRGMSRDDLIGMGLQMWSGQAAGLDLPDNPLAPGYQDDQDPTTVTGSFITVSHAVKGKGALSCLDCHTQNGQLDFAALGYSEARQQELVSAELMHSGIQEYKGPETCVACHAKQAKDMFGSLHYQWNGPTPNVPNIDGTAGKGNGSFNTYCGATNASRRIVCWQCHVGYGKKVETTEDVEQLNNIDCMMCHQDAYKRKAVPTIPTGDFDKDFQVNLGDFGELAFGWDSDDSVESVDLTYDGRLDILDLGVFSNHWLERGGAEELAFIDFEGTEHTWTLPYEGGSDDLTLIPDSAAMGEITPLEAARTVHMPTRASCLQCHATAAGGDGLKRGDLAMAGANPPVELDVHLSADGANLTCQACHQTQDHRMLGRGLDLRANDRPEMLTCDSLDCHTSTPHHLKKLNDHTARVACQTCHISTYAKLAPTEVHRDWLDPHWVQGLFGGQGGYKPREHTASDLIPTYGWYDGTSEVYRLGQVPPLRGDGAYETAAPIGSVDSNSKIYPLKEHTANAAMHSESGQLIPSSTTKFFFTGKFEDAVADGMSELGLTGNWSVENVHAYQTLNHGVEPKESALDCGQCHRQLGSEPTRLNLRSELGYGLKAARSEVCLQLCHETQPSSQSFVKAHDLHVDDWGTPCDYCHTFSRPERDLHYCSECH